MNTTAIAKILQRIGEILWNQIIIFAKFIKKFVKVAGRAFVVFMLVPVVAFYIFTWLTQWVMENTSLKLQFTILLLLLPLIIAFIHSFMNEDIAVPLMTRKDDDDILGNWHSLIYPVTFLVYTLPYFSGLSCTLKSIHWIRTVPDFVVSDNCVMRFSVFYIWNVLDAIPLLKIPVTMQWLAPHQYTDVFSGIILLVFKIIVIFPFIKAFMVWRQNRKKKEAEAKSESKDIVKHESGLATSKA